MKRLLFLLLALFFSISLVKAQDTEFWFGAPDDSNDHGGCDRPTFLLISTTNEPATVQIFIGTSITPRRTVNIPANSYHMENFTTTTDIAAVENLITTATNVNNPGAGRVQNKAIHITATAPVSAYYQINGECSKDVFTLKGRRALGTHFFTPFQTRYGARSTYADAYNHFVVVATEDNTTITIQTRGAASSTSNRPNPSVSAGGSQIYRPSGNDGTVAVGASFNITLSKGQSYTVRELNRRSVTANTGGTNMWDGRSLATLAGTEVTSDKPIAITVAEPGTTVRSELTAYPATDLLGDQIVPVRELGTHHAVVRGFGDNGLAEEWVYLTATENNTTITVNTGGGTVTSPTLNKGQHWAYRITTSSLFFTSSSPVYCYHQSAADSETGAALIPSLFSISAKSNTFYKQGGDVDHAYIFLIYRDGAEGSFTINGAPLTVPTPIAIPGVSDWVFSKVNISSRPAGLCTIENLNSSFSVGFFSYKTTTTTSYGYLSKFGEFSFGSDTIYKCKNDVYPLDAGYNVGQLWTLPNGSTQTGPIIYAADEGLYSLTVDHDYMTVRDSVYIKNRFGNIKVVGPNIVSVGTPQKFYVDLGGEYSDNAQYEWTVSDGITTYPAKMTDTVYYTWTDNSTKKIVIDISDSELGCDTTIVKIITLPDNIIDVECFVDPPAQEWGIREIPMNTAATVDNYGPLMVGDLDGDGKVEIVGFIRNVGGQANVYPSNGIRIFNYDEALNRIELKKEFLFSTHGGAQSATMGSMALARYNNTGYIVVSGTDDYLYAYNINGDLLWKSDATYHSNFHGTVLGIADFNNDGIPEVYTGDQIYSLSNGRKLCDGNRVNSSGVLNYSSGHSSMAADMNGDGKLELVAGVNIYDVNITNNNGTAGNTLSLMPGMQLSASLVPAGAFSDGATQVVDIDNDGQLEVVVMTASPVALGSRVSSYVWKPVPGNQSYVMGSYLVPAYNATHYSIPMIGNIDDEPNPEIVFITNGYTTSLNAATYYRMYALKFNPLAARGSQISLKWQLTHTDGSGCTGSTLFDFNQDGKNEIVYRDEQTLRIIDGSITADTLAIFNNVTSGTLREFPIIADIDNDGQAEIIVAGNTTFPGGQNGFVRMFKTNGPPWAPARKVWNQYAYNAVNVNEDLTIPKVQLHPATVFPGPDGTLGNADDVRPYNNFMQQQTLISKDGMPIWITPNAQINVDPIFNYDVLSDSMTITVEVYNAGDAAFQNPFYISVYKNKVDVDSLITTYTYNSMIFADSTAIITFGIPDFVADWHPFDSILIRVNDIGNGYNHQLVCDSVYRDYKTSNIIASDDRYIVFENSTGNALNVSINDILPLSCTNPTITFITSASHGTATAGTGVDIGKIIYTPQSNYLGRDTLRYRIHCSNPLVYDEAMVYINVIPKPDNIDDADCVVLPIGTIWDMEEVTITTFNPNYDFLHPHSEVFVGDLNDDGIPEIVGTSGTTGSTLDAINIYDNKGVLVKKIPTETMGVYSGKFGIAKVRTGVSIYKSLIIIAGSDGYLYAYDYDFTNNTHVWVSDQPYYRSGMGLAGIGFADFNSDGYTEIYLNNTIFDAATGILLCRGTGKKGAGLNFSIITSNLTVAADINEDGKLELLAGTDVYSVDITNRTSSTGNTMTVIQSLPSFTMEDGTTVAPADGLTTIADMDLDGYPDVIVQNIVNDKGYIYLWSPHKNQMLARKTISTPVQAFGVPLIGDIDGDGSPEIVFMTVNVPDVPGTSDPKLWAFKYDGTTTLSQFWQINTDDRSGFTGITLFDFNQDGISEIVYRDNENMRIMNASGKSHITGKDTLSGGNPVIYDLVKLPCSASTAGEYPVVADLGEGTRIVTSTRAPVAARLRIFKQGEFEWAPSRKVWNQYAYFAVHVNEDLTIPAYQLNPATRFPGLNGILGDTDDLRPYNNFLQQQTTLSSFGTPLWTVPDVVADASSSSISVSGNDVIINACFTNQGDATFYSPIFVTAYRNSVGAGNIITMDSADIQVLVGDAGCVSITITNAASIANMYNIIVRINDKNNEFPIQMECEYANNELSFINPFTVKKEAILLPNTTVDNGTYPNPVSILGNEVVRYTITATNPVASPVNITIVDTLPAYLVPTGTPSGTPTPVITPGTTTPPPSPARQVMTWLFPSVASNATVTATFDAMPQAGAVASQPLFINSAWVTFGIHPQMPTNNTYHQGAGISIMTFSAGFGGSIYNATEQVLDYLSTPSSGIVIATEEGYVFAGWSHGDYLSLRGVEIKAQEGIMHYDTLTVYGNVELHASFEPEEYAITYYLNGGANATANPEKYTIKSGEIALETPQKDGDTFIGWTGSNGEEPQQSVVVPSGSTGELLFYANFLHSGREEIKPKAMDINDKVWSVGDDLYVSTNKAGSIVRIYSLDGVLREQRMIVAPGITTMKLSRGLYVVTINNSIGYKVALTE